MDKETKELLDAWNDALKEVQYGGRNTILIRVGNDLAAALEDAVNALEDELSPDAHAWPPQWMKDLEYGMRERGITDGPVAP